MKKNEKLNLISKFVETIKFLSDYEPTKKITLLIKSWKLLIFSTFLDPLKSHTRRFSMKFYIFFAFGRLGYITTCTFPKTLQMV